MSVIVSASAGGKASMALPKKVCVVTPGPLTSSPRAVKEAQALHEAGFDTTLIATRMLDHAEARDQSLMRRIPWRLVRIDLRSRWRSLRAAQMVARGAFAVLRLGRFADIGFSACTLPLLAEALRTPADLYIAHYPAALPAVVAAARRYGARYAYDAEDFHLGDWPDVAAHDFDRALVRSIEGRYLPGCAYVSAASPGISDAYKDAYGIERPSVLLNVFPLAQAPASATPCGTASPGPSVYWFSQVIGANRGLECAVRAIGLAKSKPHLYLRGVARPNFVLALEKIAVEGGAAGRLHVLAPADPDDMERLASAYDVGLVAETSQTRSRAVALTNKLFTYLLAGVPAVMSDIPAHRTFAAQSGTEANLFRIGDPVSLADCLDRLLGDRAALSSARAKSFALGQDPYNWDRESARLVAQVSVALSSTVPAHATSKAASAAPQTKSEFR